MASYRTGKHCLSRRRDDLTFFALTVVIVATDETDRSHQQKKGCQIQSGEAYFCRQHEQVFPLDPRICCVMFPLG